MAIGFSVCNATAKQSSVDDRSYSFAGTRTGLYEDTPYDQNAILHVMLDAPSLVISHQEIRRIFTLELILNL